MTVTVEIGEDLERRLDDLVSRTGQSRADVLRDALTNGLEDIEDYFDALAVSDRVRRGVEKTFSAEELRRDLGVDD